MPTFFSISGGPRLAGLVGAGLLGLAAPTVGRAQVSSLPDGRVGIGTPAPTQTLDVNGQVRVRGLAGSGSGLLSPGADGTLQTRAIGPPLAAGSGLAVVRNSDGSLGSLDPAALPGYARRAVALGSVGGSGTVLYATSGNYTVTRLAPGRYRLSFTPASGLSGYNLAGATLVATIFNTPGLVSYQTFTGYVEVYTYRPDGRADDRGFSFSLHLP